MANLLRDFVLRFAVSGQHTRAGESYPTKLFSFNPFYFLKVGSHAMTKTNYKISKDSYFLV